MLWTSERILIDGDAYFDALIESWSKAQETIDLETYIFEIGAVGQRVEAALLEAASRGLHIRLLVDGIGASGWWQTHGVSLQKQARNLSGQLEVRVYHPVFLAEMWRRLMIDFKLISPERQPRRSLVLRRLNRRNHRKVSIVDGTTVLLGSVNISNAHSAKAIGSKAWRDTSAVLTGPGVLDLRYAFDHAWLRSHFVTADSNTPRRKLRFLFPGRSKIKTSPVGLNFTRTLRREHRFQFARNLDRARSRIWIENAYLAPPSNVVRRLVIAARRGVDVRIIVPSRSDVWFMPLIARAYYRNLIRGGVRVFEYQPRFLHSKSLIVDDTVILGTSNLNRRSFLHDLEVDVTLSDPRSLEVMISQFERDQEASIEMKRRGTIVGSRLGRLLNYLFRYWV